MDWAGRPYHLDPEVIRSLPTFNLYSGYGLVLLDRGDELIDSESTAEYIGDRYPVVMFEGGSHRFEHTRESLPHIRNLINSANSNYGVETE